jgi:hypothetical protein
MPLAILALPLACRPEPPGDRPEPDGTPTAQTGHTGTPPAPHSAAPTDCPEAPGLTLAVTAAQGALPNQVDLAVTATAPASVAARCVADADPDDVHLAESTTPALAHDLRVGGLLTESAYTCAVVATCPRAASPPVTATWTTGALPFPLDPLGIETPSALAPTPGYTLANWELPNCLPPVQDDHWAFLWDARGALRWWYPLRGGLNIATEVNVHPTAPLVEWGGGDTA